MAKKFVKGLKFLLISGLFMTHLFTYERHRNNFIEYDHHFFIFIAIGLVLLTCMGIFLFPAGKQLALNRVSVLAGMLVLFVTIQSAFNPLIDKRIVILFWLIYGIYYSYSSFIRHPKSLSILILAFSSSVLVLQLIRIFGVSLFTNILFQDETALINSGVNANYMASVCPFLLSVVFYFRTYTSVLAKTARYVSITACMLSIYFIVISQARTAWIASFISISLVFIYGFNLKNAIRSIFNKPLYRIALFILLPVVFCYIVSVLYHYKPDSAGGRLLIYKISLEIAKVHPLAGIGIDRFEALFNNFQAAYFQENNIPLSTQLLADNTFYAFNEFLQMTIELGLTGVILLLSTIYAIFKPAIYHITLKKNDLLCGAVTSLLSVLICSLFSYPLHTLSIVVNCVFYISIISYYSFPAIKIQLRIWRFSYKTLLVIVIPVSLYLGIQEYNTMMCLTKWEKAAYLSLTDHFDKAKVLYQDIYPQLNTNGKFLFNYGAELSVAGEYQASAEILERAKEYYPHNNLYLYLATDYRNLNVINKAILNYNTACAIAPSKFTPKYHLLTLYEEKGMEKETLQLAKTIVSYPVKVPSPQVENIKEYALKLLQNQPR